MVRYLCGQVKVSQTKVARPGRSGYIPDMITTVEAVIGADGVVRLLEPVPVSGPRRALVTILGEEPVPRANEPALLSESALADWNRPEEDAAWAHLQSAK
jgi:hypothetical protein